MIIKTSAELHAWCAEKSAAAVAGLDADEAVYAIECVSSVVWRHAVGQGLGLGDDWGWILELYDSAMIGNIVSAAAESRAKTAAKRRRRGY